MTCIKNLFYILIFCLVLCSCQMATDNNDVVVGDTFVSAGLSDAIYINPLLACDSASAGINAYIFNGLLKYDKDLNIVCDLAESYEVLNNGLKIIFKLKQNILWHDDVAFNVKDVEFTYRKLIDENTRTPFSSDYTAIKEFKVIDDYTFSVEYSSSFAPVLESWCMGIIPEHIYKNEDINNSKYNRMPVGTGPYKFKKWVTDQKIILEANPSYYEGKPEIAYYLMRVIPDQAVQFLELRTETIDEISLLPDQWNAYDVFFKSYKKYRYPAFSFTFLGFNLLKEPYNKPEFRHAINYALNKKDIIDGVLAGMAEEADGIFPPCSWAYKKEQPYPYNPQKAKDILKSIGFTENSDEMLDYKGKKFEINIITNYGNKSRELTAQIIQQQLKKAGLYVNVRVLEWSTFINQYVNKKNFDAIILGWNTAVDPDQFSLWHSSQTNNGQYNFMSYKNDEVDRLLEKGRTVFDKQERIKIYHKIQDIMHDDPPCIFLYYPQTLVAIHERFNGIELTPAGIGWNFNKWYVKKEEIKYKNRLF